MYKTIAIKIGSNVLTRADGMLDEVHIAGIVDQLATLHRKGVQVILISSGAVAAGRQYVSCRRHADPLSCRQLWASVGQVKLMNIYSYLFSRHNILCSQVLVTKEDFSDRKHYLNTRNSLMTLLDHDIIPVINENDVVSVTELMFTDNDELASLLTPMVNADAMVILSNVDGIFDGDPGDPESKVIPIIDRTSSSVTRHITTSRTSHGRGGMTSKFNMARKVAEAGIPVHLVNGKRKNIILDIVKEKDEVVQTFFKPKSAASHGKKWLTHSAFYSKGEIHINEGAFGSLMSGKAVSLLPVGVTQVKGSFMKGDIVRIINHEGNFIGLGKSQYSHDTACKKIGVHNAKPVVHYDYLYLRDTDQQELK
jgi:glutamate 5-kinase